SRRAELPDRGNRGVSRRVAADRDREHRDLAVRRALDLASAEARVRRKRRAQPRERLFGSWLRRTLGDDDLDRVGRHSGEVTVKRLEALACLEARGEEGGPGGG